MSTQTAQISQTEKINGINVKQLAQTIHEVRRDPQLAAFTAKTSNQWIDGTRNNITIKDFYVTRQTIEHKQPFHIAADEPPVLCGDDTGANPVEILLGALSGCMTTTLAVYSAVQGQTLERVESTYEGDLDLQGFLGVRDDVHKGYKEIRVKFKVKGDVTEEQIKEMVKKSPVYDTLTRPIQIKIDVEKA